jgi:hypothetical protein
MNKNKRLSILIVTTSVLILTAVLLTSRSLYSKLSIVNNSKINIQDKVTTDKSNIEQLGENSINNSDTPDNTDNYKEVLIDCAGDCTLGYDDKFSLENSLPYVLQKQNNDYSYFFKNVYNIFKSDDITTVNLETTLTNSSNKADKQYAFKGKPDYAKILSLSSVEGVNVSNNHIYDYGINGFKDTLSSLKAEGVSYFGEDNLFIKEVKGAKFGFLGYRGFYYDKASLNKIKSDISNLKSQGCYVIINFHFGDENSYTPNSIQKYLAHFSIDNGADLIIGHHPHVVEEIEQYKGKLICYSLGNFCFGGNTNPRDKDTFIFQSKLKFNSGKLISQEIRVIPCSISSLDYINDYCPTPMEGIKKADFLTKLNNLSKNAGFRISDEFTTFDAK